MSEYVASLNASIGPDIDLLVALGPLAPNPAALAKALTEGGGTAGSVELENFLLAVDRRNSLVEIVKKAGRGQRNIQIVDVQPEWFEQGLPADVRTDLIAGIESGAYVIRTLKRSGAVGRPSAPFGSHVDDWLAVEKIMRRSRGRLSFEQAADEYIDRERIRKNRGRVRSEQDLSSAQRRLRRLKKAASDFKAWADEIRN